ncbi:FAD/NAD(P)-binding protein [Actinomadura sp. DC4]|uniref:FAD/NAD(P)-binding protein n=1 Tax=Actinomadura sp. DC4 TaxID=3055069 RepID=UPI0025B15DF9|nr:FAD/NAD(P)-binding protein [Actinomadura sp. DC4]MDN3351997.1 FAD/NAD(P)-binding protein [Actinomadura sp. DC4]
MSTSPLVIVLVGAGPGGTVLLERLIANAPELAADRPVRIHVADPHPPGGGRVWRLDQPDLLWMNSQATDVTMFTDETVLIDGPVRPGPTLCEWGGVEPGLFPSRRLQNAYLSWCFEHVTGSAPESVEVEVHAARVLDVTDHDGAQLVRLEGREEPIAADAVILSQGHLDVEPADEHRALAGHAAAHGLTYVPPHYAADTDLTSVRAGEPVVMRGMGLGFVDDMVLLTEGRGGRYTPRADGGLTYHPSGREPILYAGSRRGVPYHSKITYELGGERPPGPRHFTPAAAMELYERQGPLDLWRDLWPLIAKELSWYHYHELFSAHPERVAVPWAEFEARLGAGSLADFVEGAVPKAEDRLDLDRLLDPLGGVSFEDAEGLQAWMRAYVTADVERHADPAYSADLAVFFGLLTVFGVLVDAVNNGRLAARSQAVELGAWLQGVFGYYASGPPPRRLRELEALSRAGVVRFLGGGVAVTPGDGVFRARGTAETVDARALVESRLPAASIARTTDPLLRALHDRGEATEEVLTGPDGVSYVLGKLALRDGRLLRADGGAHPRRFALGAWAGRGFAIAGFTRPRTNALSFRLADALARDVLAACRA